MRSTLLALLLSLPLSLVSCARSEARTVEVDAGAPMAAAVAAPSASAIDAARAVEWPRDANTEGWCVDGLVALDAETCVAVPDEVKPPRTLLIYLHGTIDPRTDHQRKVEDIVAANAKKRGYVGMVPRGRRGIGPNALRDWWAWPTTRDAHKKYAREIVEGWMRHRAEIEERLGAPFEKVFVAGSSNGAYFTAVLALRGEVDADGFGALSGGSRGSWTKQTIPAAKRPPFYVGYGAFDDTHTDPASLGALLTEAGWPHDVREHRIGHGAYEIYLDEAMPFWGGP